MQTKQISENWPAFQHFREWQRVRRPGNALIRTFTVCLMFTIVAVSALSIGFNVHLISNRDDRRFREKADEYLAFSAAGGTLASGAASQAASLEETAASLEELSAMTRKNAENSVEARSLMAGVEGIVANGRTAMEWVTGAIREMGHAGEKTSWIIKTIDEIAFQTNLLALNAAVEAARAERRAPCRERAGSGGLPWADGRGAPGQSADGRVLPPSRFQVSATCHPARLGIQPAAFLLPDAA